MLNHAVLISPQNLSDSPSRKNRISDLTLKKTKFEHTAYNYSDIFLFKYVGCCFKRHSRREKYEEHMKIISERMEIKNLLSREACASALSQVLMQPYQIKITAHFKKSQNDATQQAFDLPIDQAIEQLNQKFGDSSAPEIEQRMNQVLIGLIQNQGQVVQDKTSIKGLEGDPEINLISKKAAIGIIKETAADSESKQKAKESPKKQGKYFTPPMDFFGSHPKFFINSELKTVTWVGFLCTLALFALVVSVLIIYLRSYSSKASATINSVNFISSEHQEADLKSLGQLFAFQYYLPEWIPLNIFKIITPSYYLVTENPKMGLFNKTPLAYVDCAGVKF